MFNVSRVLLEKLYPKLQEPHNKLNLYRIFASKCWMHERVGWVSCFAFLNFKKHSCTYEIFVLNLKSHTFIQQLHHKQMFYFCSTTKFNAVFNIQIINKVSNSKLTKKIVNLKQRDFFISFICRYLHFAIYFFYHRLFKWAFNIV